MRSLFAAAVLATLALAQFQNLPIGIIDFYGLDGLDPAKLRAALSVHQGDKFVWPDSIDRIRNEAAKAAGRPVTSIGPVCCDAKQQLMIYVGLAAERETAARPKPVGDARLPEPLLKLYDDFIARLPAALKHPDPEDRTRGYSLFGDPIIRQVQLEMREAALVNEDAILKALAESADNRTRVAAAHFAGYIRQSPRQIAALIDAARDPNDTVRNNATRALGVLAATPEYARQIPPEPFIEKLNSHVWSDRNKGLMLLVSLTRDREPQLLKKIRAQALPALIEMSHWQNPGHAASVILILGRIAGIDEAELKKYADEATEAPVLAALSRP